GRIVVRAEDSLLTPRAPEQHRDVGHTSRVQPLVRPPRLHLGRAGEASRLELFFDLAYVLVILELAHGLYVDASWHGLLVMGGLFTAIWFSWMGFTLYANRFDTDDLVFRLAKLGATAAIAGCAASASDAVGKFAVPFAASYLLGRVILLGLYGRAWRHVADARPTIDVYLVCIGLSTVLWAVSIDVPAPERYWLWAVAVLVDAVGPVLATLRNDRLPLHIEHLPERFGLLVILVLGEAVGGAARGTHDASWAAPSLAVGILGLLLAASLWWAYFDIAATTSAHRLEQAADGDEEADGDEPPDADQRHDLFVFGHFPLALGTVLAGVGLEGLAVHPETPGPSESAWVLAGGLALFYAGTTMVVAGTARSWRPVWPWPLVLVPVVVALGAAPLPSALLHTAAFTVVTIAAAVHGTVVGRRPEAEISVD
ncbi:MAG: low temperature requirement protein A, partial [Janthinobacterium lividum]